MIHHKQHIEKLEKEIEELKKEKELLELDIKYANLVIKEIQTLFDLTEDEANLKLNNSAFPKLMENDSQMIFHYTPSYWANIIMK